jgi:copper homeostasis protein
MNRPHLEIASFNTPSALAAFLNGADRIELCASPEVGGTTPTIECLREVKAAVNIPLRVMIRPRGGDFVYSDSEFSTMKDDMINLSGLADGFVFGVLTTEDRLDVQRNKDLITLAGDKSCTFHRAFDELSQNMDDELEMIRHCGFEAILTSGGAINAVGGAGKLAHLVKESRRKEGFSLIVGGGVRSTNIRELIKSTQAPWFHSSALVNGNKVASEYEIRAMVEAISIDNGTEGNGGGDQQPASK